MADEPEPIEVQVSNYDELIRHLYNVALQHRESFEGMAVSHSGGASIFVEVQEKGQKQRYVFSNPNPNSMRSFWLSLRDSGYLQGAIILHEDIIRDVNALLARRRLEKESAEATQDEQKRQAEIVAIKERRESRRWWVSLLVQSVIAIAAAVVTAVLADYYSSRILSGKVNELEKDVSSLKASVQAGRSGASLPNTKPASTP